MLPSQIERGFKLPHMHSNAHTSFFYSMLIIFKQAKSYSELHLKYKCISPRKDRKQQITERQKNWQEQQNPFKVHWVTSI